MITFISILAIVVGGLFVLSKRNSTSNAICKVCNQDQSDPVYINGFPFCPKHAKLYQEGEWVSYQKGSSSPSDPDYGVRMHELQELFASRGISSFIQVRYESREEEIVTLMELMVLKEDLEKAEALSKPLKN